MDIQTMKAQVEALCKQAGLSGSSCQDLLAKIMPALLGASGEVSLLKQQIQRLGEELEKSKAESERLFKVQAEIAELLKAKSPDSIMHDLRNVLNELSLLKAVVAQER
jgi:uncharacterized membrane protein YqgA involved in biofilm formation